MKNYILSLSFLVMARKLSIQGLLLLCSFALYNCSVTKHLEENQYLLYKQTVKGTKNASSDDLIALYRQKPNRKVLGTLPYLKAYYIGKRKLDTVKIHKDIEATRARFDKRIADQKKEKKADHLRKRRDNKLEKLDIKLTEGNWLMRTVGEPPAIFDTSYTYETARQFRFYLNSKGYFNNLVTFKIDTNKRFVTVGYTIVEGQAFKINQINYNVKDSAVSSIILQNNKDIKIKIGENYDEGKISEERERINKLLKNNGYYDFTRQYIFFEIDTTIESKKTAITIRIENPPAEERHRQYTISKIVFNTDVTNLENLKRDTSNFRGVDYVYYDKRFSKKILDRKIKIYPGDLYNQSRIQLSQRQLGGLDMYKFVNVNFDKNKDSLGRNTLTAYINASPLKKYQISDEAGLNISYGFVPGPFGSLSFKERNTFGGFEVFDISLRASILGQAGLIDSTAGNTGGLGGGGTVYQSEEYNAEASLTFPQLFFPTPFRHKFEDYNPKTRVLNGASIIRRPEYTRLNIKGATNYSFNKNNFTQYNVSLIDINYIRTTSISKEFDQYLENLKDQGNNLKTSFSNSIVSDINGSYIFNNNELGTNRKSRFLKLYAESGGTTLNLLNQAKIFSSGNDTLFGLKTFRYLKIVTDLRYYFPINKNTFVIRLNAGIAKPYDKERILPYEKYFFSGGSNSIRAWPPRRLGPGSYGNRGKYNDEPLNYKFESPGEMLLETNFEYRFKMIGFFEGALFVDAGNVWVLSKKFAESRPGSEFVPSKFLSQIAIGTGYGLRLNFSFLILRLDIGIKAWDPAQLGSKMVLGNNLQPGKWAYNIGIGYPF